MWLLYPQILDANEGIFEEGVAESLLIDCILSLQEMVALSEPSEAELNTMDVPALRSLADTLRIKLDEDVSNFEQE